MEELEHPKLSKSIEKTRDALAEFVIYPPLKVKYLKKPPFLFFHDIVTYVIRNHGFLNGLFKPEELNRNLIKTCRKKKADFLQKFVTALRMVSGDKIPNCDYNRLASGRLPFLSNLILRSLANALKMKMSCSLAVKKLNEIASCENASLPKPTRTFCLKRKFFEKEDTGDSNSLLEINMKTIEMEACQRKRLRGFTPNESELSFELHEWDPFLEKEQIGDSMEAEYEKEHLGNRNRKKISEPEELLEHGSTTPFFMEQHENVVDLVFNVRAMELS